MYPLFQYIKNITHRVVTISTLSIICLSQILPGAADLAHALSSTSIPSGFGFMQMVHGGEFGCGLRDDNTVWCWGYNKDGQLGVGVTDGVVTEGKQVQGLPSKKIDALYAQVNIHPDGVLGNVVFALMSDGTLYAWGDNTNGVLGFVSPNKSVSTPTLVPLPIGVRHFSTQMTGYPEPTNSEYNIAYVSNYATLQDGSVYVWGHNINGALGLGESMTPFYTTPTKITALDGVNVDEVIVHTASNQSYGKSGIFMARSVEGSLYAWGYNGDRSNLLGLGNTTDIYILSPTLVSSLSGQVVDQVLVNTTQNEAYALVRTSSGVIYTFRDPNITGNISPSLVSGFPNTLEVEKIFVTAFGSNFARMSDGALYAWGNNNNNVLSTSDTNASTDMITPLPVLGLPSGKKVENLYGDAMSIIAHMSDGTLYAWGNNASNYLSTVDSSDWLSQPTYVGAVPSDRTAIDGIITRSLKRDDSGYGPMYIPSTYYLMDNGYVYSAGYGGSYAIGYGGITPGRGEIGSTPLPVTIKHTFPSPIVRIYTTPYSGTNFALLSDGTLWGWGNNGYGQLGNGTMNNSTTPVQVAGLPSNTTIAQVYVSDYTTLALLSDGTLWGWGYNGYGQLGNGTTNWQSSVPVQIQLQEKVTQVGYKDTYVIALLSDTTPAPYRHTSGTAPSPPPRSIQRPMWGGLWGFGVN